MLRPRPGPGAGPATAPGPGPATAPAHRAVALLAVVILAGACTGDDRDGEPVPVAPPTATPRGCSDFAQELPGSLGDGLGRRRTSPEQAGVAAYGDPPVVVRCGAAFSPAYHRASPLVSVNKVDWFQEVGAGIVTWSTPNAFVNVEVRIPTAYDSHGAILARLTDAARAAQ